MRAAAVFLSCVLLAACGWQLRGASQLTNIETLDVRGASFEFRRDLVRLLERDGILVHEHAPLTLDLTRERWTQRIIGVDALGREAERELRLSTGWRLRDETGQALTAHQVIQVIRSFNYDPTNVAAASDEEQITREAMYRDALGQLMRQLEAASARLDFEETD